MGSQNLDESLLRRTARSLRSAERIVIFTGAGVSAESGIGTFRDDDGLWSRFPPEEFAQLDGLMGVAMNEPGRAAEFFLALLEPMARAQPNAGHRAIAALEKHKRVTVITQNVDGLHEAAGSSRVLTVHGRMFETVNADGSRRGTVSRDEVIAMVEALRPLCRPSVDFAELMTAVAPLIGFTEAGLYRPNIVLFGESLCEPDWRYAVVAAECSDFFLSVGTSATVYPAAGLPVSAKRAGATVVAIDPLPVANTPWLAGAAGEILPALIKEAFES